MNNSFTDKDRYTHSVLFVCSAIHESFTGSSDVLATEELDELVCWLDWRINKGWTSPISSYDTGVWNLAFSAIEEGRRVLSRLKEIERGS